MTAEVTKLKKENKALSIENSNLREQAQAARELFSQYKRSPTGVQSIPQSQGNRRGIFQKKWH
ncbi:MAG: hypothetical protein J1F28_10400 [Oscillospiraceae bacterium]|nr:hypothetical protein [Oscillospiraceae bacterium]